MDMKVSLESLYLKHFRACVGYPLFMKRSIICARRVWISLSPESFYMPQRDGNLRWLTDSEFLAFCLGGWKSWGCHHFDYHPDSWAGRGVGYPSSSPFRIHRAQFRQWAQDKTLRSAMRLKSSISSAFDSVTQSTRLRYKINYPQKLSLQNNFAEIFSSRSRWTNRDL